MNTVLITGGAGFIGSNFVRYILNKYPDYFVINLDKLTYAGVLQNLQGLEGHERHFFIQGDICDRRLLEEIFSGRYFNEPSVLEKKGADFPKEISIAAVINFAAESHVDRSILDPEIFLKSNVYGTGVLLDVAKTFWQQKDESFKKSFRYVQISTDEVYGSLGLNDPAFTETSPLLPNSPYAAGKAGGDCVVRSYHETYGLPVLTTRCSNNYGPYQFPEKLIPLMITHILDKKSLPVYGDGKNIRDWIHVSDHCSGIDAVWHEGRVGEIYNIGGENEWCNIDIVNGLCDTVDDLLKRPRESRTLIRFVKDRLGHDRRYALGIGKIKEHLGWKPSIGFEQGLKDTVAWYLEHSS
ncbi:MAG: dTDP-glucose 4,6-dehydratase [Deltaproteobacteria bacterium]|nr:dTDP-glucose 4,6-dehydratase [Deltaproteobacteria bacterium]